MGCSSSNAKPREATVFAGPPLPEVDRRRLSVSNIDKSSGEVPAEEPEQEEEEEEDEPEERGFFHGLDEQSAVEMVKTASGVCTFSIASQTDEVKTYFADKAISLHGDALDPGTIGVGYSCRKGLKPESPNQDSWFVLRADQDFSIYGVFDGHGQKGHDVSEFVKENLPKLIIRDQRFRTPEMPAMLKDIFRRMQCFISTKDRLKELNAQLSGTTATVAVHDHRINRITVAHVADSSCVLGKTRTPSQVAAALETAAPEAEAEGEGEGEGEGDSEGAGDDAGELLEALQITRDHKPDLKDERERIEKAGGRVVFDGYANHRVYAKAGRYPGLNMSRCLGDLMGHVDCGISCEPEVTEMDLTPQDQILLLCSDGVWEFTAPAEAMRLVAQFPPNEAMAAASTLAKHSWDRWIEEEDGAVVDDITVLLVHLGGV